MVASGFAVEIEDRGLGMGETRFSRPEPPAGRAARVRRVQQRAAGPVRGRPAGQAARHQGHACARRPTAAPRHRTDPDLAGRHRRRLRRRPARRGLGRGVGLPAQEAPRSRRPPSSPADRPGVRCPRATERDRGPKVSGFSPANGSNAAGRRDRTPRPTRSSPTPARASAPTLRGRPTAAGTGGPPGLRLHASGPRRWPGRRSPDSDSPQPRQLVGGAAVGRQRRPADTGLPWPYDRPAPRRQRRPPRNGSPSFTPNEPPSIHPASRLVHPERAAVVRPAPRSPFPPARSPGPSRRPSRPTRPANRPARPRMPRCRSGPTPGRRCRCAAGPMRTAIGPAGRRRSRRLRRSRRVHPRAVGLRAGTAMFTAEPSSSARSRPSSARSRPVRHGAVPVQCGAAAVRRGAAVGSPPSRRPSRPSRRSSGRNRAVHPGRSSFGEAAGPGDWPGR